MADIAAADLTYTEQGRGKTDASSRRTGTFKIQFGDGALTYPSGGIPLSKGKMGCPTTIEEFMFVDMSNGDGYLYKYDFTNEKIRIYQGDNNNASDAALIELGSVAIAATSLYAKVTGW